MRRIINFLQTRFSGLNSQDIFRPANIITVGPYNCDFTDLSLALENSLPNQEFFIFGGTHQGRFNLKDGQKFHLFGNPAFIAPQNDSLFFALYYNNHQNVTVHFFGRGSFVFSAPDIIMDLDPNVINFQIYLDLFIQCTVSQHLSEDPHIIIVNSNVYYHYPGQAIRNDTGDYSLYLLPYYSISVESSILIDNNQRLPVAARRIDPHRFDFYIYDRNFQPADDFLFDLTLSTKSIASFT